MKLLFLFLFSSSLLISQTFVYECQNDKNFIKETSALQTATSSFTLQIKDDQAWLFTKDISMALPRVISASGTKYEANGVVFWSQGYEAMLDTPTEKYRSCSNNRLKAIWEDAKLRGFDFRAVGNEPGWVLEIGEGGKKTLLVTDYGEEKYELVLPRPYTSKNTSRYIIKDFIEIILEDKKCMDSMSNNDFETTVTIKLNSQTYRGCGKSLH